ncbi:hypothetical protein BKA66DRAFT_469602 [Pyrenochaeta sp. MPI-SDFR-AT-0127]|nr:hypothetical protein BKA66DRAFT_469602 [Pyrenochaeta sp. MPI-SDFR-AT-0127]
MSLNIAAWTVKNGISFERPKRWYSFGLIYRITSHVSSSSMLYLVPSMLNSRLPDGTPTLHIPQAGNPLEYSMSVQDYGWCALLVSYKNGHPLLHHIFHVLSCTAPSEQPYLHSLHSYIPEGLGRSRLMVTTRTTNYDHDCEPIEHKLSGCSPETLSHRRLRWSHLIRSHHYQPVIEEVLNEELPKYENSTVIDITDRVSHVRDCALILASAPSVFAAAVHGNLVQRMMSETDLQEEYVHVQERAHQQPSIYIHLLADEYGIAPTPNQYSEIRKIIIDYLAEGQPSAHAWHIDNTMPPVVTQAASAQGYRKYIHTKTRSPRRVETLHRFCQGVLNRWLQTDPSLRDTPFQFPPGECGYSKNSHTRLAQHRAHQSSNYVMNLVEDICTYLHRIGEFKQHFRMHQFIIYLIFRPSQAALAEIFCSRLLQVWIDNGGGFNTYPAGCSVATSRRLSSGEWKNHETWVRRNSPMVENMRMLNNKADEWRRALEWETVSAKDLGLVEDCEGEGAR